MLGCFDYLDCGVGPNDSGVVYRERDLREAEAAVIQLIVWADNLKDWDHVQRVIQGNVAIAEIDVEKCGGVADEPARLKPEGATRDGPFCSILRYWLASACI